jgi:hypothetical protein
VIPHICNNIQDAVRLSCRDLRWPCVGSDRICNAGVSTIPAPEVLFWNSLLNEDSTGNDIQGHEKKLECGLRRYDMSHLGK